MHYLYLFFLILSQITEYYAFLPREAVTKFLTQCHECRRSMKVPLLQEVPDTERKEQNDLCNENDNQQQLLKDEDYPKNIENYYLLLKALYENSSIISRIKNEERNEQSSEESFKENNLNRNNKSSAVEKEPNMTNLLGLSINTTEKTSTEEGFGNDNKLIFSHTSTPTKMTTSKETKSPINQQLVTSTSLNEFGSGQSSNNNKNSKYYNNSTTARADSNMGVTYETVPDDSSLNYRDIKHNARNYEDNNNHRRNGCDDIAGTPCNNNNSSSKYTNGENEIDNDYRKSATISIETSRRAHLTGDIKPITSTYLLMTRSMGLTDDDALNLVSKFSYFFCVASSRKENKINEFICLYLR